MRQALVRPIEITSANNRITISGTNYDVTARVYANIFDLLKSLKATALADAYITSGWRVALTTSSGTSALTKTALSDILGFDGTETGARRTATYAPAFCWASTHQSSNPDRFCQDSDGLFQGSMAADGNLTGSTMTTRERCLKKWPWEPAVSAYPSAAASSYSDASSGVRYPEQHSCFWTTVNGARSAYLTASSSNNVSNKGVYFIPRATDFIGSSPTFNYHSATWDSGGTVFDATTVADRDDYVFCSIPEAPKKPDSVRDNLMSHYNLEVELVTAVAPTWETT